MNAKSLLIPLAAFAVTVSGASAFNRSTLEAAGLTAAEISAFEEAYELRRQGDRDGARAVLAEAGVDLKTLETLRDAMHHARDTHHHALEATLEAGDFAAFKEAIADSPLADIVTSEEDFALFREAHELKEAGDREAAEALFAELGLPARPDEDTALMYGKHHGSGLGRHAAGFGGFGLPGSGWHEASDE